MKCVAANFVPKLINFEQKQCHMDIALEITGDELWNYSYDIETKAQSFHWKCPEETKKESTSSSIKCEGFCSLFFFVCNGAKHYELMREAIRQKRKEL